MTAQEQWTEESVRAATAVKGWGWLVQVVNAHGVLVPACQLALAALVDLSEHPAFRDDAAAFNHGGSGYVAAEVLKAAIAKATNYSGVSA